jgi:uncharacterized membrane protein YoaT (DUF817 family)
LRFKRPWQAHLFEFVLFGFKQGWASLFGALMLAALLATHRWYPADAALARYDFLVIVAVAIQGAMLVFRLETVAEAKVILAFHIVGTIMEIFKTAMGSWVYPEDSLLRLGGVPLFSGFMYAAVGSYIARIWRIFAIQPVDYPPRWQPPLLARAIYVNFFTHHFLLDARWLLFAATVAVFRRTWFVFTPLRTERRMPILLGFVLVAGFIWVAENLATYSRAWLYPMQTGGWTMVPVSKLGAWLLLMIISFVLVSLVHGIGPTRRSVLRPAASDTQAM